METEMETCKDGYVDGMGTETMEETISLSRQYRDAI